MWVFLSSGGLCCPAFGRASPGRGCLTKKKPFEVKDGHINLPTGPGLGIELDDEAIKEKTGHNWSNPETYYKMDGSVVDW